MEIDQRTEMALVRMSVLGPLISARLEHGDRARLFEEAAQRTYVGPDGRAIRVTARTVEDWYYAFQRGGFEALKPQQRSDAGRSRVISESVGDLLVELKLENPPALGAPDHQDARARRCCDQRAAEEEHCLPVPQATRVVRAAPPGVRGAQGVPSPFGRRPVDGRRHARSAGDGD